MGENFYQTFFHGKPALESFSSKETLATGAWTRPSDLARQPMAKKSTQDWRKMLEVTSCHGWSDWIGGSKDFVRNAVGNFVSVCFTWFCFYKFGKWLKRRFGNKKTPQDFVRLFQPKMDGNFPSSEEISPVFSMANGLSIQPHSPTTGQNHCQRSPIRPRIGWVARSAASNEKTKFLHTGTNKEIGSHFSCFNNFLSLGGYIFGTYFLHPQNLTIEMMGRGHVLQYLRLQKKWL